MLTLPAAAGVTRGLSLLLNRGFFVAWGSLGTEPTFFNLFPVIACCCADDDMILVGPSAPTAKALVTLTKGSCLKSVLLELLVVIAACPV